MSALGVGRVDLEGSRVRDPARYLYEVLRDLERRAAAGRRHAGLSASRQEAAVAVSRSTYGTAVDVRQVLSWLPDNPALAQTPRTDDADKVWALVRVWSEWAGDPVPQQPYWRDLIDAAQSHQAGDLRQSARQSTHSQQLHGQPGVFISYAHDDAAHEERVRKFWLFLRAHGIDAQLDVIAAQTRQDWGEWMTQQVRDADRIVVVASPAYKRRAEGDAGPGEGPGLQWEARLIRDRFYVDQRAGLSLVLPIVLPGCSAQDLPLWLAPASTTCYRVNEFSVAGAENLLRLLLAQPREISPDLGPVPYLPPRGNQWTAGQPEGPESTGNAVSNQCFCGIDAIATCLRCGQRRCAAHYVLNVFINGTDAGPACTKCRDTAVHKASTEVDKELARRTSEVAADIRSYLKEPSAPALMRLSSASSYITADDLLQILAATWPFLEPGPECITLRINAERYGPGGRWVHVTSAIISREPAVLINRQGILASCDTVALLEGGKILGVGQYPPEIYSDRNSVIKYIARKGYTPKLESLKPHRDAAPLYSGPIHLTFGRAILDQTAAPRVDALLRQHLPWRSQS